MIAKAELRYVRLTPRKFRQIIPLIKGKNPEIAIEILMGVKKNASLCAIDLLKSAVANAKNQHREIDPASMFISKLIANCGPQLKRFRAASMGRASMIRKRTSHLIVELDVTEAPVDKGLDKKDNAGAVKPKAVKKASEKPGKTVKTKR